MNNLTLIIPVLNEKDQLKALFARLEFYPELPLLFCDAGSQDGSVEMIQAFCERHSQARLAKDSLSSPSILKTLCLGLDHISTKYLMIHPVDANAELALNHIALNHQHLIYDYYIFFKKYDGAHPLLIFQEWLLNLVRLKLLKNFVWTNCPILKKSHLEEIELQSVGFLEDVISSDTLKSKYKSHIIETPVIISSRRYQKDGVIKRFLGNALIMILFRLKLKSVTDLKKMYYGQ